LSRSLWPLSVSLRRILDRLIAQHLTHYMKANGQLMVSYEELAAHAGADKSDVSSALAELVDVGLTDIKHGQWSTSTKRLPNRYRLTFFPVDEAAPTHEWKRFEPSEGAGSKRGAWR
jgi:DNA-binding IclR family transcriptional regulator